MTLIERVVAEKIKSLPNEGARMHRFMELVFADGVNAWVLFLIYVISVSSLTKE